MERAIGPGIVKIGLADQQASAVIEPQFNPCQRTLILDFLHGSLDLNLPRLIQGDVFRAQRKRAAPAPHPLHLLGG